MSGPLREVPCKRCGRKIVWVETAKSRMPLDPNQDETGNVFVSMRNGAPYAVVASKRDPRPPGVAFIPHFSTCPALNKARPDKPAKLPPPAPAPELEL